MTLGALLEQVRGLLQGSPALVEKGSVTPESERIVQAAFAAETGRELPRLDLYMEAVREMPGEVSDRALRYARERAAGTPLQHVTGVQFFFSNEYPVGPDVLVPRPETELLVSTAIERLKRDLPDEPILGLEVGLGSGAIAIELLAHYPGLTMIGTELTREARKRCRENAHRILGPGERRLEILKPRHADDVVEALEHALEKDGRRADFLISNPPYLHPEDEIDDEVVRHEPREALFAPVDRPLHFYEEVASKASGLLRPGGWVFMELSSERAAETGRAFEHEEWPVEILPDLAGRDRILVARNGERYG